MFQMPNMPVDFIYLASKALYCTDKQLGIHTKCHLPKGACFCTEDPSLHLNDFRMQGTFEIWGDHGCMCDTYQWGPLRLTWVYVRGLYSEYDRTNSSVLQNLPSIALVVELWLVVVDIFDVEVHQHWGGLTGTALVRGQDGQREEVVL